MGVIAHSPPNFEATEASYGENFVEGPIKTYGGFPPEGMASGGDGLIGAMNGVNQAVYAFAGAILFFNFLAEMRNPWDFWKSLICAQCFIFICYMTFGLYVYSFQGQVRILGSKRLLIPDSIMSMHIAETLMSRYYCLFAHEKLSCS
jgi:hypothetical protein